MANEIINGMQKQEEKETILSRIMGFFGKSHGNGGEKKKQRLTKAFHITRKNSIISIIVALIVICGTVYYGKVVIGRYVELNNRSDELKKISSYNVKPDADKLSAYVEGNNISTINGIIGISNAIEEELASDEMFKKQQRSYYELLLQNLYLPSLNVWKDPYTKNFNMGVLGQKYLEADKFQDLYLIQYWSDFVKYVGNDADYNLVENITVGSKVVLEDNPEYFYTPITITFSSPNKRSFLLFVNKLATTSNQNNIALLNEFFFYLLGAIREEKSEVIDQLMQDYWDDFSSSSSWEFGDSIGGLTDEEKTVYRDKVIGYNLYHWVNGDLPEGNASQLIDDEVIIKAVRDSVLCASSDIDQKCFYNFREKYRNLPYLAYKVGLENQSNRTNGLLEFLQDLPPAVAITNFGFEKYSNSSFLNNKQEQYEGKVEFNAYGRNITDSELEEASDMLGKLCFGDSSQQQMSPDLALSRVEEMLRSLGGNHEYSNVYSLGELQGLFTSIKEKYGEMNNYEKIIKLFEIWRMMNDANLCNK